MIWFILMADFISGNPVQQNLMDEEIPTSYFNSIITTLMQVNINVYLVKEMNCDLKIDRDYNQAAPRYIVGRIG